MEPEALVHLEARIVELEREGFAPSAWRAALARSLEGAVYPLERDELVLVGRENEAERTVLTLLSALPNARYPSEEAVVQAVDRIASRGP